MNRDNPKGGGGSLKNGHKPKRGKVLGAGQDKNWSIIIIIYSSNNILHIIAYSNCYVRSENGEQKTTLIVNQARNLTIQTTK